MLNADHAENVGECLPSNLQQLKTRILHSMTFNFIIVLTKFMFNVVYGANIHSLLGLN